MAHFAVLAVHTQVWHAAAQVDILHGEFGDFLAPDAMVEQRGEQGTVPQGIQVIAGGELHEMPPKRAVR